MKNISWCPCLKVRVNFLPRRNYAAHFTVAHDKQFKPVLVYCGFFKRHILLLAGITALLHQGRRDYPVTSRQSLKIVETLVSVQVIREKFSVACL